MVDESAAMADTVRRLTEVMNTQFEQGLAVSARHNAALEEELARSRANVGKVHAALVEMTGELVKQVERAPEP